MTSAAPADGQDVKDFQIWAARFQRSNGGLTSANTRQSGPVIEQIEQQRTSAELR
ncbi:UNVERIFIED_ORG: hypothetical protein MaF1660_ph0015 [Mycobacterium phage Adler]